MDKRNYEEMTKDDLIEIIDGLELNNHILRSATEELREDLEDLNKSERLLVGEIEDLEERIEELEEQLQSIGFTKSRNFTIDNLYYLLVDRYGLSHHTSKDKLKALVDEELSL